MLKYSQCWQPKTLVWPGGEPAPVAISGLLKENMKVSCACCMQNPLHWVAQVWREKKPSTNSSNFPSSVFRTLRDFKPHKSLLCSLSIGTVWAPRPGKAEGAWLQERWQKFPEALQKRCTEQAAGRAGQELPARAHIQHTQPEREPGHSWRGRAAGQLPTPLPTSSLQKLKSESNLFNTQYHLPYWVLGKDIKAKGYCGTRERLQQQGANRIKNGLSRAAVPAC